MVVFAIACMGLNILVGHTGLVSFGHGAWFGLGAYAAALSQRYWFPGDVILPALFAVGFVAVAALASGALILRRRGVYFSLLTLALTALLFAIGYRWTEFTGGESGLGGVTRATVLGINLETDRVYYAVVAAIGMAVCYLLWRFHRSPVGSVLVAIRENEQRARFIGYPTNRYKLIGFVLSATVVAVAGTLSVFNHRFASAEPLSVAFSGELIAMVVIGGMRSFLGPALGALFFILFREFLSIWTPHWLFWFGLLFVGFIVFSPTGLVGVAERLLAPFRKRVIEAAAMAGREVATGLPLPDALRRNVDGQDIVLSATDLHKSFGGIRAVDGMSLAVRGPHAARADRPQRRRQDHGIQPAVRLVPARPGHDPPGGPLDRRAASRRTSRRPASGARSRSPTCSAASAVEENIRLAVQARHRKRLATWTSTASLADVTAETAELMAYLGLKGIEPAEAASLSYGGQRLLDMGLALATRPRVLLLDEPLAGLAAAERAPHRGAGEDAVGGNPGAAGRARHRPRVPDRRPRHGDERGRGPGRRHGRGRPRRRQGARGLYRLGRSGARREAAHLRRRCDAAAGGRQGRHVLRQEPHPARRVARRVRARDRGAARPQRRRQVDAAQDR